MSLQDELHELSDKHTILKLVREQERDAEKAKRDEYDNAYGKKHGIEDIAHLVATIRQQAANGLRDLTVDVEQVPSIPQSYSPPYANGYFEVVRNYMLDNGVAVYQRQRVDSPHNLTIHSLYFYW